MNSKGSHRRGMILMATKWILVGMLGAIIGAMALAYLVMVCLVLATRPRVTKILAAIGTGIIFWPTYSRVCGEPEEMIVLTLLGESMMFTSYTLHAMTHDIRWAKLAIRRWLGRMCQFLKRWLKGD